jgi:hypothetical protein
MSKKKTATAAPKNSKRKARGTAVERLQGALTKLNASLTRLLEPKFKSAGIEHFLTSARTSVVEAGLPVRDELPAEWKPTSVRAMTPERLEKLRERAARLQERLEAAEAAL